jgi:CBS domain-containing protein
MKAGDIMTRDVLTVGSFATISAAIEIMVVNRVSGVPVVASDGKLVGVLTQGDLLRRVETGTSERHSGLLSLLVNPRDPALDYVRTHSRRVDDIMTAEVVTVTEETPLSEVVSLLEKHRIRRVPVVQGDRLTGILSRADLVAALGRKLAELPLPGASDQEIQARVVAQLHGIPGVVASSVRLQVRGGVVTLSGVIHDQRARGACCVAAENVAGVVTVEDHMVFVEPLMASFGPNL